MFRLRRLLEWKEALERIALAERAALESRMRDLRREVEHLRRLRARLPETTTGEGADTLVELAQWSRYAEGLRRREAHLQSRLEALRPEVESKVRAHLELRKEVKGLRKLEERERARAKKQREKRQQESIDEAAGRRFLPETGTIFRELTQTGEPDRGPRSAESRRGPVSDPIRGKGT